MIYKHEQKEDRSHARLRPDFPAGNKNMLPLMKDYLSERGLSFSLARLNGWYPTTVLDGYPRIVIPCSNSLNVSYFQARDMTGTAFLRYLSPAATREDSVVLVWNRKAEHSMFHHVVICEGPMDVLAAGEFGMLSIAVMGNQPPRSVCNYIVSTVKDMFQRVIVIPDMDNPCLGAYLVGFLAANGIEVHAQIPYCKDLAAMEREARAEFMRSVLEIR